MRLFPQKTPFRKAKPSIALVHRKSVTDSFIKDIVNSTDSKLTSNSSTETAHIVGAIMANARTTKGKAFIFLVEPVPY